LWSFLCSTTFIRASSISICISLSSCSYFILSR
jgi:hypothetical protein